MGASVATYYDILRISRRAEPDQVRTAYRRLAQKYHPDKLPGKAADAEHVMAALNEAYAVLSDPQRRASYDRAIAVVSSPRRAAQSGHVNTQTLGPAWPWYLLGATLLFALASVATVVYKSAVPSVAAPQPVSASAQAGKSANTARR